MLAKCLNKHQSSHSPENISSAGPVIYTWLSDSFQESSKSPPARWIVTLRSVRLFKTPATHTAEAPVPQASVSPDPRSHVRCLNLVRDKISTNSTLTRLGK